MSITKIHAITGTINKSIAYICNSNKTNGQALVSSYMCNPADADLQFKYALKKCENGPGKNLAYHLIQSFKPDEVNEELAHQMAEELAKEILGSKYSYVIATHNDKGHVHSHIIFCAADNIDHKKYHSCKESYRDIRRANDKINIAHGLEVIKSDPTHNRKSHSYAEWKHTKAGTSWKANLKKDIKDCLKFCPSYDEFLKRMNERGYEIKNANPSDGKYISFRAPGQEKWIRGRASTLGEDFTREGIINAIHEYINNKDTKAKDKIVKNITIIDSTKLLKSIDTSDPEFQKNVAFKIWAERENFKRLAHNYNVMRRLGLNSISDITDKINSIENESDDCRYRAVTIDRELESLDQVIAAMEQYLDNKPYHDKYRAASNKEAVLHKYEMELTLYDGAKQMLKDEGISLRTVSTETITELRERRKQLIDKRDELLDRSNTILKDVKELQNLKDELSKQLELKEREEQEKNLERKKARGI